MMILLIFQLLMQLAVRCSSAASPVGKDACMRGRKAIRRSLLRPWTGSHAAMRPADAERMEPAW